MVVISIPMSWAISLMDTACSLLSGRIARTSSCFEAFLLDPLDAGASSLQRPLESQANEASI